MRRGRLPQGLKSRLFCERNGTAEAVPFHKQTLSLGCWHKSLSVPFHKQPALLEPLHKPVSIPFHKQLLLPAFFLCVLCCMPGAAQTSSDNSPADSKPKADIIFEHGNIYTGVPANAQFSAVEREEAMAVRGDRILAIGKIVDLEKLKGPQTQ